MTCVGNPAAGDGYRMKGRRVVTVLFLSYPGQPTDTDQAAKPSWSALGLFLQHIRNNGQSRSAREYTPSPCSRGYFQNNGHKKGAKAQEEARAMESLN